jgi:hypothetical protein
VNRGNQSCSTFFEKVARSLTKVSATLIVAAAAAAVSLSPPTPVTDGPPSLPFGGLAGAGRERSGDPLPFVGLVFFLGLVSSDINKVVVKMTLWSKVSPASPYLDDVLSGVDEGPVRVGSARSVDYLQIFAVGVFVRRCSWLSFVGRFSSLSSIRSSSSSCFFNPLVW